MARDPNDVALEQQMPEYFAEQAKALGAPDVSGLSDTEHKAIANAAFRENMKAKMVDGPLPKWLAKLQAAGLTDREIAQMAENWDDQADALGRFQRECARYGGFSVPEPKEKLFGDPFAGF